MTKHTKHTKHTETAKVERYIGAGEAAKLLGVSGDTVRNHIKSGLIPVAYRTPGGQARVDRAVILQIAEGLRG